jgi:hypothetical protein
LNTTNQHLNLYFSLFLFNFLLISRNPTNRTKALFHFLQINKSDVPFLIFPPTKHILKNKKKKKKEYTLKSALGSWERAIVSGFFSHKIFWSRLGRQRADIETKIKEKSRGRQRDETQPKGQKLESFTFCSFPYFPTNQTYSKEQKEKEKRKYLEERLGMGSRDSGFFSQ